MKFRLPSLGMALLLAATSLQVSGQETKASTDCRVNYRHFVPSDARREGSGAIIVGQTITRLKTVLGQNSLTVVERPSSTKDLDLYSSVIVVGQGVGKAKYPLGKLVRDGNGLRLIETAELCTSADSGVLFLAFAAGATSASEGFIRIAYSPSGVEVRALPMSYQGRILVRKTDDLRDVEVWSATDKDTGIICDACRKRYLVEDCHVGDHDVACKRRPGAGILELPAKFERERITIH